MEVISIELFAPQAARLAVEGVDAPLKAISSSTL
jgi:hypothetical protein